MTALGETKMYTIYMKKWERSIWLEMPSLAWNDNSDNIKRVLP
jgi:hypothetical protein